MHAIRQSLLMCNLLSPNDALLETFRMEKRGEKERGGEGRGTLKFLSLLWDVFPSLGACLSLGQTSLLPREG